MTSIPPPLRQALPGPSRGRPSPRPAPSTPDVAARARGRARRGEAWATWRAACLVVGLGLLAGCASRTHLSTPPHLLSDPIARSEYVDGMPATHRIPAMRILFASDRSADAAGDAVFGFGRAGQLVVGDAEARLRPAGDWDALLGQSLDPQRSKDLYFSLGPVQSYGRLAIPLREMIVEQGRYRLGPEARAESDEARARLAEVVARRLADGPRDVYVYIHGYNNSFEHAVFRAAQIWHYMGRRGAMVAYTWPAGRGGLAGYAYDRESGEYTVFHLKLFLRALIESPQVERVHVVAHSRGCDVAVTALRELAFEEGGADEDLARRLKLANLVLAAPDLDAEVYQQRFALEDLHLVAERTTIYLSRRDFALSTANWLFSGLTRLGNVSMDRLDADARAKLAQLERMSIVDCDVTGFSTSHNYAFEHPAVLSDLVLLLRDRRPPGAGHGRPLAQPSEGVWQITNAYLAPPFTPAPRRLPPAGRPLPPPSARNASRPRRTSPGARRRWPAGRR